MLYQTYIYSAFQGTLEAAHVLAGIARNSVKQGNDWNLNFLIRGVGEEGDMFSMIWSQKGKVRTHSLTCDDENIDEYFLYMNTSYAFMFNP